MQSLLAKGGREEEGRDIGALGDLGEGGRGRTRLLLLNGWASSSVGRHSERWIALESVGMIRDTVGKTTQSLVSLLQPFRRSSTLLPAPIKS